MVFRPSAQYRYFHSDREGTRRLLKEWKQGLWVLVCTYTSGHPKDNQGRPMLMRARELSPKGRARWAPFVSIHNPKKVRLNETATWRRFVLKPGRDDLWLTQFVGAIGLEPKWTTNGRYVRFFRTRLGQ
jgi:hypothetical protein